MRLFFALWPDDNTRIKLAQRRIEVVRLSGGRPLMPASLHMTLVYIGEVSEARIRDVNAIGDGIVHAGFDYPVDTAACFSEAGVSWLGAANPPLGLFSLQMQLRVAVNSQQNADGFAIDKRRFRPHITVVREIEQPFDTSSIEPVIWSVRSFSLVNSRIDGGSAQHEVLRTWPLRDAYER
ncbi:MAG TPA: RNA 2',3'-cyclic phosphodiesterase [Usitatibacteraceae bacterium]